MDWNGYSLKRDRPGFSKAYGINPKQKKGLLPWDWVAERMSKARNYWVVSSSKEAKPHVAPVWGLFTDNVFYFSTGDQSIKARNLSANPMAVIHLESGDETVIFEGTASIVSDKALMARLSVLYNQKYPGFEQPPDFGPGSTLFAVHADTVFAWTEADFVNTATRWKISA